MKITEIKKLYKEIEDSIFTIAPVYDYNDLASQFILLCEALIEYKGETEDWAYWGESSLCPITDLISGAFWHYSEWHSGQTSASYAALSALGKMYKPNTECAPEEDAKNSQAFCYRSLDELAEAA
jgi:hypothetical protein